MAEPVPRSGPQGPDTGGRSLADILREAGIENPSSKAGRRRRWDDFDDTGIRQRSPDPGRGPTAPGAAYGRRASDLPLERPDDPGRRESYPRREADLRGTGRLPRDTSRDTPRDLHRQDDPRRERDARREPRRPREDRALRDEPAPRGRSGRGSVPEPSTAAIPGLRPSRQPSVPAAAAAVETPPRESRRSAGRQPIADAGPATGRIPAVTDEVRELDDDPPRESALAWLRFAGELLIAAAVGVGIYFLFTVLWQTLPHVAVVVAPLAVTGLVTGVSVWRQRFGHAQVGPRLLAVLVFAGTLLTVLPVAGLVGGG